MESKDDMVYMYQDKVRRRYTTPASIVVYVASLPCERCAFSCISRGGDLLHWGRATLRLCALNKTDANVADIIKG